MANLFAQLAPRKGSHPKNPFGAEDGPAQRLARFESALADFARQAGSGLASVAMPANIGCGKAGGPERLPRGRRALRGGAPDLPRRALPLRAQARPEVNPLPPVLLCE